LKKKGFKIAQDKIYRLKPNKMKTNQRRMIGLLKMFKDIELFYSITFTRYDLRLSAEFNSDLAKEIISLRFTNTGLDANGYLCFKRNDINIVLT